MLLEGDKVILCHGVVDLRKGAAGLLGLMPHPKRGTWYLFSNRGDFITWNSMQQELEAHHLAKGDIPDQVDSLIFGHENRMKLTQ